MITEVNWYFDATFDLKNRIAIFHKAKTMRDAYIIEKQARRYSPELRKYNPVLTGISLGVFVITENWKVILGGKVYEEK